MKKCNVCNMLKPMHYYSRNGAYNKCNECIHHCRPERMLREVLEKEYIKLKRANKELNKTIKENEKTFKDKVKELKQVLNKERIKIKTTEYNTRLNNELKSYKKKYHNIVKECRTLEREKVDIECKYNRIIK